MPVKTLYIEIVRVHQTTTHCSFVHMYSSKASVFLLGIKMRIVMDHRLLTYAQVKAKADCLWSHQDWFLAQMETCLMWDISTLDLVDC